MNEFAGLNIRDVLLYGRIFCGGGGRFRKGMKPSENPRAGVEATARARVVLERDHRLYPHSAKPPQLTVAVVCFRKPNWNFSKHWLLKWNHFY